MSDSTVGIETRSPEIIAASRKWKVVNDLMDGTQAMISAGTDYVPYEGQAGGSTATKDILLNGGNSATQATVNEQHTYNARLNRATLFPGYSVTIDQAANKMFSTPVHVEGTDTNTDDFLKDVDRYDNSISQFSKQIAVGGMNHGCAYILVDYPQVQEGATRRDEGDVQPYWISIDAVQVIDIQYRDINGKRVMSHFRYKEIVSKNSQYGSTPIEQIRVFFLDDAGVPNFETHQKASTATTFSLIESGIIRGAGGNPLTKLPIVAYVTNMVAPFLGTPPLMELAYTNVKWWRADVDYENILHFAQFPIIVISGSNDRVDDNGKPPARPVGAGVKWESSNDNFKAGYMEHSGKSIEAGRQNLNDIKDEMAAQGLELVMPRGRSGDTTATGRVLDSAENSSRLKSMALLLGESIANALRITQEYTGTSLNLEVTVNTEFSLSFKDTADVKALFDLYRERIMSAKDLLEELKLRNTINFNRNVDDIIENAASEKRRSDGDNTDENTDETT